MMTTSASGSRTPPPTPASPLRWRRPRPAQAALRPPRRPTPHQLAWLLLARWPRWRRPPQGSEAAPKRPRRRSSRASRTSTAWRRQGPTGGGAAPCRRAPGPGCRRPRGRGRRREAQRVRQRRCSCGPTRRSTPQRRWRGTPVHTPVAHAASPSSWRWMPRQRPTSSRRRWARRQRPTFGCRCRCPCWPLCRASSPAAAPSPTGCPLLRCPPRRAPRFRPGDLAPWAGHQGPPSFSLLRLRAGVGRAGGALQECSGLLTEDRPVEAQIRRPTWGRGL